MAKYRFFDAVGARYVSNAYVSNTNLNVYFTDNKAKAHKIEYDSEDYRILRHYFSPQVVTTLKKWVVKFTIVWGPGNTQTYYMHNDGKGGCPIKTAITAKYTTVKDAYKDIHKLLDFHSADVIIDIEVVEEEFEEEA